MMFDKNKFDKTNAVVAGIVTIFAFIIYNITKAPSLSFWDCGEFIAAAHMLGIPHPPGTPLYIIVARIFSILPLSDDPSVRINLLSVIPSTFSVLFGYLALVRVFNLSLPDPNSLFAKIQKYTASTAGALLMAFSNTNWNNAVETEVYGLAMMIVIAMVWLTLIYYEKQGTVFGEKLMYLIIFLAFLGIGVHMTTYLFVPVLALFFIVKKKSGYKVWFSFAVFFAFELYLIFAFSSKPGEISYDLPSVIILILYLFFFFSFEKTPKIYKITAGLLILPALPLLGKIVTASSSQYSSLNNILSLIGTVGLFATALFGLYQFYLYFKNKNNDEFEPNKLAAFFLLAPIISYMSLNLFHGYDAYKPFLVITAVLGLLLLLLYRDKINWLYLLAIAAVSLVVIGVKPFFIAIIGAFIAIPIMGKLFKLPGWRNAVLIVLVAIIGYSTHLYIPIRSDQNPKINENNPGRSIQATIDYIERKQYGSMSMTKRMFKRRAEWENQFGDYRRMGFWNFFSEQYGVNGKSFVILFMIGLFGIWEVIRKRPKVGLPLVLMLLIGSVGLILYMNFADGLRQDMMTGRDYLEVRDRDYFFTPAYMLFGLFLGLGIGFLSQLLKETTKSLGSTVSKGIASVTLLTALLPLVTLANNYETADRSGNFIPYSYAYNLLISCDPNAVLFTAGDNDTFPLWCVQDAYNVRPDVSILNLSLANTDWYLKQLTTNLKVKTSWDDEDVDKLRPFMDQNGVAHRLKNQAVTEIIQQNVKIRPINFSVTVPSDDRRFMGKQIDSLLELRGLVWTLTGNSSGMRTNMEVTMDYFFNKFKYDGINDESVYKDEATIRTINNVPRPIVLVADSLRALKLNDSALVVLEKIAERIPQSSNVISYMAAIYDNKNDTTGLQYLIDNYKYADVKTIKMLKANVLKRLNRFSEAEALFYQLMDEYPTYKPPFDEMLRDQYQKKNYANVLKICQKWLANTPDDQQVLKVVNTLQKMNLKQNSSDTGQDENTGS